MKKAREQIHDRLKAFVDAYRVLFDAGKSAIAAGYSAKSAHAIGTRLLKNGRVQEMLAQYTLDTVAKTTMTNRELLGILEEQARFDIAELFAPVRDSKGRLAGYQVKNPLEMPKHVRQSIQSLKIVKKNLTTGDGVSDQVLEVKLEPRQGAAALLMKHRGLLNEIVEHHITVARLDAMTDEELLATQRDALGRLERHMAARARLRIAVGETPIVEKAKENGVRPPSGDTV